MYTEGDDSNHDHPCIDTSMSRRALLIHAPKINDQFGPLGTAMSINYMAVGLPALAAALEGSGRPTEILHLGVQRKAEPHFDLAADVAANPPQIVGFSMHWHAQAWDTVEAIRAVRRGAPNAFIVLGGFTASAMHADILATVPEVDGVIRGDGETALLALADALDNDTPLSNVPNLSFRDNTGITQNAITAVSNAQDISGLFYERFDLLRHADRYISQFCGPFYIPHERPQAMLMQVGQQLFGGATGKTMILPAGRGCSVTCGWCGGGKLSHKKFHGRSNWFQMTSGRTAALIARSVDLGFSGVQACFDPTPANPQHWIDVADKVAASGVRTNMYFESYALPHPDLVDALVRSFDSVLISMSPESPDEAVRRRFRPLHFSNDELVEAVKMCAKKGANVMLCFGQGLPGETLETPKTATKLVNRCKKAARGVRLQCRSFAIEMEPGSPWAMKPEAYGIELKRRSFADYIKAHRPGVAATLGYRLKDASPQFAEIIREEACKQMCPLPPSPRLGHLTCKALRTVSPNSGCSR
jgi:radical SAM superfamily enzyme YgiQ (UPF0313 family)